MSFPQTTPMRPVPGAFLNTPAAAARLQTQDRTSRRLFSHDEGQPTVRGSDALDRPRMDALSSTRPASSRTGSMVSMTPTSATTLATTPISSGATQIQSGPPVSTLPEATQLELPPVSRAARQINHFLQHDESFPGLDHYCGQGASSNYEIPRIETPWAPFQKTQMYPIPNAVFNHYNAGQLQTLMGLFAEINHAWVAIDDSLFMWDYTHPDPELIGFEEQPHTIHAVALLPPKPGIFSSTITHILVVATSSDILLLGISATDTPAGTKKVALYQTGLNLSLRGIDVRVITGSSDGRIFFGGAGDTDVHELYYQSEEKWFSSRCGKINHTNRAWSQVVTLQPGFWSQKTPEYIVHMVVDASRSLLYTLSSKSTIRTYHMEAPNKLREVIVKGFVSCLRDIAHMITQSKLLSDRTSIISISPIPKQEASKLHLMAVTNTGCRLFFSATSESSYLYASNTDLAPRSMQVQYIKFPPSARDRTSGAVGNETAIDLESTRLDPSEKAVRFSPGYFLDIVGDRAGGNDWVFVSAADAGRIKNTSTEPNAPLKFHEQASWINIGSRAEAIGLITKPFAAGSRPVGFGNELAVQFDESSSEFAILTNTGVHVVRRRRFVDIFASVLRSAQGDEGYNQSCRHLVQLYGRVETVSAALAVACGHGGDANPGAARATDQVTEDRARACFIDFGGQPTITETDTALTTDQVRMSSRHDALATYLARLVRKLWKMNVISVGSSPVTGVSIIPTVPISKLSSIQENVERLRRFLHSNRGLIQGLSGPSEYQRVDTMQEEVALKAEHQALHALQKLMESISEGISFSLMLFDERVIDIYSRLDDVARRDFEGLTYEKLFSQQAGKDLAKLLVKAIVNRNIESGSNVETVADALRRRCGSFCSSDDVVIFKAQEQLQRASEQVPNSSPARTLLHESLRLFEKVAGSLSSSNLQAAVNQFVQLEYYAGATQLCLAVAREQDRGNTALSWVNDGKPEGDARAEAHAGRKRCYDMIHDILDKLDNAASREPEMVDGKYTLMTLKRQEAYEVVNNSDDEVFHFDLYEWYIGRGWTDQILAIDSRHVLTFLQRLASTKLEHADLLCRFYTNRANYFGAAEVQAELANSDFDIGIKERIKLLGAAKNNATVPTVGITQQQRQRVGQQAMELLELANIQDALLERLRYDRRIDAERLRDIVQQLDGRILDISDLFNQYADQAGYYDLCLQIYHVAEFRNTTTIATTWSNLITTTHEEVTAERESVKPGQAVPPMPYEVLSSKIQALAHHTSMNPMVFPIETLLPELCRYSVVCGQDASNGADTAWPVQLFLSLGVPHDPTARILENVLVTQDYGFSGLARFRIVELVVYVVDQWAAEVRRRGGGNKGNTMGGWVLELLERCESTVSSHGRRDASDEIKLLGRELGRLQREVAALVERTTNGSFGYL